MSLNTTVGSLLVNSVLPPELRDYDRVLDKNATQELFTRIAKEYPERYPEIAKKLMDIGLDASTSSGGFSFGPDELRTAVTALDRRQQIRKSITQIMSDTKLSDKQRDDAIVKAVAAHQKPMEDEVYEESLSEGNPLAYQVSSGARGNRMTLRSLRGSDLLYVDNKDNIIPIPILRSYSEGLTPAEYFASAFGVRKGLTELKLGTARAGFLGKNLVQAAHRLLVTQTDDADDQMHQRRGMPVDVDDKDSIGSLLSYPAGPYPRNTVITPRVLKDLEASGIKRLVVRSPLIGGPNDGGLYAKDLGMRERGLAERGTLPGIDAAQAIAEPISQNQLGSKHKGGVASASTSGFKYLNALANPPKLFPGAAAHAQVDGVVQRIEEAPAGGKNIVVDGTPHYVAHGFMPSVKAGDKVEAGDVLSDGASNPRELATHKGIGEARRYFAYQLRQAMKDSGMSAHRRNTELLARAIINHVTMHEQMGPHLPGDLVPYDILERSWEARPGTRAVEPRQAVGKYLEVPVLHHSIGTRIRPSMLKDFNEFGVKELSVHDQAPPFAPTMLRAMDNLQHDPDWMTRQFGSGLQKGLLDAAHRGLSSTEMGTSFVPSLAKTVDFGQEGLFTVKKSDAAQATVMAPAIPGSKQPEPKVPNPAAASLAKANAPPKQPAPPPAAPSSGIADMMGMVNQLRAPIASMALPNVAKHTGILGATALLDPEGMANMFSRNPGPVASPVAPIPNLGFSISPMQRPAAATTVQPAAPTAAPTAAPKNISVKPQVGGGMHPAVGIGAPPQATYDAMASRLKSEPVGLPSAPEGGHPATQSKSYQSLQASYDEMASRLKSEPPEMQQPLRSEMALVKQRMEKLRADRLWDETITVAEQRAKKHLPPDLTEQINASLESAGVDPRNVHPNYYAKVYTETIRRGLSKQYFGKDADPSQVSDAMLNRFIDQLDKNPEQASAVGNTLKPLAVQGVASMLAGSGAKMLAGQAAGKIVGGGTASFAAMDWLKRQPWLLDWMERQGIDPEWVGVDPVGPMTKHVLRSKLDAGDPTNALSADNAEGTMETLFHPITAYETLTDLGKERTGEDKLWRSVPKAFNDRIVQKVDLKKSWNDYWNKKFLSWGLQKGGSCRGVGLALLTSPFRKAA